ncbi:MAG: glycosyltransferase family 2 protein [Bacteroidota bacterium]
MTEISIVVPVFNSSMVLPELNSRVIECLAGIDYELILVNDCSHDNSWEVMRNLAADNNRITAINLRKNSGQDNAILAGLRHASGNYVVIMDDDLQHAPADIITLHEKCKEGFDVVYAGFAGKKQALYKQAGSRANGTMASVLLSKPGGIYLSPFKIIRKGVAAEIALFAGPYPYIDGIILTITNNIGQIAVAHHERFAGKSNYSLNKSASVMFRLFTGFSILPLRIATILGLAISLAGFGLAVYYLCEYFFTNHIVEGWITLVVLIIFFGGLTIMLLGLLGEYLGRIYLTLNRKPQYSISSIIQHRSASKEESK